MTCTRTLPVTVCRRCRAVVEVHDSVVTRHPGTDRPLCPGSGESPFTPEDAGLAYIRMRYGVPAHLGGKIRFRGVPGWIAGWEGGYLIAVLEGARDRGVLLHPTWETEYVDDC